MQTFLPLNHSWTIINRKTIPILIVLICLVVLPSGSVWAQSSIGIMAGPTGASMSGSYIESGSGLELGFSGGLVLDRQLGSRFILMSGIGWIQKGGKKLKLADYDESTIGYRFSYIQVPVYFKMLFPIANNWSIAPFSGVYFAFGGGADWKEGHRFGFEDTVDENSPGGNAKTTEFGIPLGVDFIKEFEGGSRMYLGARLDMGLTDVFEGAKEAGFSSKNRVLVVIFGFTIPLQ
jgi:hypothetical protein